VYIRRTTRRLIRVGGRLPSSTRRSTVCSNNYRSTSERAIISFAKEQRKFKPPITCLNLKIKHRDGDDDGNHTVRECGHAPGCCLSPTRASVTIDAPFDPAVYARMFPQLPSFQADEQFLRALGRAGGLCDCREIIDSPDSLGDTAAGWPIFGQFVAHDIAADRSHTDTAELRNARRHQLNLECLYSDGPTGHPFLDQRDDPAKFPLGTSGADLQRYADGIAIIGDPRNDSHTLISQLHLAMLKAHNAFVDEARLAGIANDRVLDEGARQLRWHYQWIVLNEVLPSLVGQTLADEVLREGPEGFRPGHGGFTLL